MSDDSACIKALKKLGRERPVADPDIWRIVRELATKGPRTATILMAALIDTILEVTLAVHLATIHGRMLSKREKEDLFGLDMPLGTLSAKITMAYSLKIISSKQRTKLNYIRHIRNVYAHTIGQIPFAKKEVRDAIKILSDEMELDAKIRKSTKLSFIFASAKIAAEIGKATNEKLKTLAPHVRRVRGLMPST